MYRQRIYYYLVQFLSMWHRWLQRYYTRIRTLRSSLVLYLFIWRPFYPSRTRVVPFSLQTVKKCSLDLRNVVLCIYTNLSYRTRTSFFNALTIIIKDDEIVFMLVRLVHIILTMMHCLGSTGTHAIMVTY